MKTDMMAIGRTVGGGQSRPTHGQRFWGYTRKILVTAITATYTVVALGGPQDGQVVSGQGDINLTRSDTTVISQFTDQLAIDWSSFNVAANERVIFQQPSSSATALNRIFDQNPSQIFGAIDANGRILLLNPNGILFGKSARINIQSLVASSLQLSLEDFKSGKYDLRALADSHGAAIINRGEITAAAGGSVSLIGDSVANEGLIVAEYGQVNLAAGRQATLDFRGDGLMFFAVGEAVTDNPEDVKDAVLNQGQILADGGQVLLTANSAENVFSSVVNNEGSIRAQRIDTTGGVIRLVGTGGTTVNSGELVAQGATPKDTGGSIDVLGDSVSLTDTAMLDASGATGGGEVRIGGDYRGGGDLQRAEFTDIAAGATIAADAQVNGDGGQVVVWADDTTTFAGSISARGGTDSGAGGLVEVSGKEHLAYRGTADLRAEEGAYGTLLLDPGIFVVCDAGNATCAGAPADTISDTILSGQLDMASVTLTTTTTVGANGAGDHIYFLDDPTLPLGVPTNGDGANVNVSWTADTTLILNAGADVFLDGSLTATGAGDTPVTTPFNLVVNFGTLGAGTIDVFANLAGLSVGASLNGGANADTFNINSAFSGVANGGLGDDTFNLAAAVTAGGPAWVTGNLSGEGGNDTFNLLTGGTAVSLIGGTTAETTGDVLVGNNVNQTWSITGAGVGTVGAQAFSEMENLTGGTANDAFIFGAAGTVAGLVNGAGAGDADEANWSAVAGPLTVTLGTNVSNVETLTGGDSAATANFTLAGGNAWNVTGPNDGTVDTINFVDFGNLTGTAAGNAFTFNDNVTGTVSGLGGDDTFTLATGTTNTVAAAANILGGTTGETTGDVLIGDNVNQTFSITGAGMGSVGFQNFDEVENLTGGTANDAFIFGATGTMTGLVNGAGAGDADEANWSAVAGPLTVTLGTSVANVETLTGGNAGFTLAGGTAWNVTGPNDGTVDGVNFVDFANLTGTAGDDSFTFAAAGTITGNVAGLAQVLAAGDVLDISAIAAGVLVDLGASTAAGPIGGTFAGIETFTGGDAAATTAFTLAGGADFDITGANDGTVDTLNFTNFGNLTGTAGDDAFDFAAAGTLSGLIDGLGGLADTANWSLATAPVTVTLGTSVVNVETLTGGNAGFTLANGSDFDITGAND
ncbi:MAG: filamentous hemagglutinin N-terminal domain-containing protein, partial [Gammaproteobacteria bacterium]|nr:filamentous hemagglutinin N-terminal domain-containing protein [Gammaproteobacteria bacterium]